MPIKRQSKPPESQAFDWRDPSMPVVRSYKMRDGTLRTEVDPDYESRYREHMMTAAEQPGYKNDPTYNLRKKRQ